MKVEFEFSVDKSGTPIIKFKHHDKSSSLAQKLLGVFIERAKDKGIKIGTPGGYCEVGTSNSYEDYEISVK